jgi:hypothetical protein
MSVSLLQSGFSGNFSERRHLAGIAHYRQDASASDIGSHTFARKYLGIMGHSKNIASYREVCFFMPAFSSDAPVIRF